MATTENKKIGHKKKSSEPEKKSFGPKNYRLLFIGLGLLFLGFILMIGGGSDNPQEFNYEVFNFRRLTLAPLLVIAGFAVEIFAIMTKPQ